MSISDLIMYLVWIFLFGVLISRTIKYEKQKNYERKRKKFAKKLKKAMDDYYAQRNETKEDIDEIDEVEDTDEHEELENFIEEVNEAWFDIDEEEALQYISDWKSPEDYVTYMEDFYQWDDDISDDDSDDNPKEKAEEYINDMSALWYDITDDDADEMAEEWFDPEDYAEEYDEENIDDL